MRLSEAFELYRLDVVVGNNMSRKTEESNKYAQRSFIKILGDLDVAELNLIHIRLWKSKLTCGASTMREYALQLRVTLRHMQKLNVEAMNWELIEIPKRSPTIIKMLSPDDVESLIEACNKNRIGVNRARNKLIISLLAGSGLRVSEMCSLDRDTIRDRQFHVVGKGRKLRPAFITPETFTYLEQYLALRTDNLPALFVTISGKRMTSGDVQEVFRHVRKSAGLENVSPHDLRHYFATQKAERGMHIFHLQRLMGHSNMSSTQIYLHVRDKHLFEIYDQYSK